jgi:hypothetical protein
MTDAVTDYGFIYGAAEVTRITKLRGTAVIEVKTPKQIVALYVTKSGQIRIYHKATGAP